MDKLSAYSAYQGSSANYVRNGKETSRSSAQGTSRTNRTQQDKTADKVGQNELNLSDEAKDLLQELKEKYRNMDFMVAHFSSDEEAQSYLSRGTKDYSVLIDPETLEAMAADLPGTRIRIKSACKSKDNARSCPSYAPKKVPWSGLFFQGAAR